MRESLTTTPSNGRYGARTGHFLEPGKTSSGGFWTPTQPHNQWPIICPDCKISYDKSGIEIIGAANQEYLQISDADFWTWKKSVTILSFFFFSLFLRVMLCKSVKSDILLQIFDYAWVGLASSSRQCKEEIRLLGALSRAGKKKRFWVACLYLIVCAEACLYYWLTYSSNTWYPFLILRVVF